MAPNSSGFECHRVGRALGIKSPLAKCSTSADSGGGQGGNNTPRLVNFKGVGRFELQRLDLQYSNLRSRCLKVRAPRPPCGESGRARLRPPRGNKDLPCGSASFARARICILSVTPRGFAAGPSDHCDVHHVLPSVCPAGPRFVSRPETGPIVEEARPYLPRAFSLYKDCI